MVGYASCDWKSTEDLIRSLKTILTQLGVKVYSVDTGGDSFAIALSDQELPAETVADISDYGPDSDFVDLR